MTRALRAATLVFGLLAAPLAATGRTPRGVRPTSPYWTPAHRIQPGSPNGTGSAGGRASWDRSMART